MPLISRISRESVLSSLGAPIFWRLFPPSLTLDFDSDVSDDTKAFEKTRHIYAGPQPTKTKKGKSKSKSKAKGKDKDKLTDKNKNDKTDPAFVAGPKLVAYDLIRGRLWDLITHRGFVTFLHHDADGKLTWITPRGGAKLWTILRLKNPNADCTTREELTHVYDLLLNDLDDIPDKFEVITILLEPGQVL